MKKILIIDDKNENFISCEAILEDNFRNCYVFKALSGKEGIKIAINEQPDVILLDIVMPEMDGYQTCKTLKKDKRTNHIPIILISAAKTDSKSRVKGLIGGADAFLSKPIDTDEFAAQIKVMLRIKEAEDKLRGEKLRFEKLVKEKTVELRDSNEKYKALYENVPLPYQSLNEYGRFNDINPAWLNSMGYERHEVIGKPYKDFLHPDHQEHFEKNFLTFKKNGYVNDVESKIRHNKGHYLDILLEGCVGYNPDGSFKQTHCVLQIITQKKLLEEELLLKTIVFDSSVSANSISNKNGILTNVNTAFLNFWGYETSDEVIGKSLTKFIKQEHEAANIINSLGNFGVWTGEYVGLKKDGAEFIANANASTLKDAHNNFIGYQFSAVDITEKKEAEEKIRWLSQAVEQSPVTIVITDLKGKIEYSNPKFTEITGYTKKEALGKNLKMLKTGETAMTDYKELWNTICSGKEWRGVFHNKKKNGELYWESASNSAIKNKEGKITHYLSVKEDITERKKFEKELQKQNKELLIAKEKSEESDRLKSAFLANMSHEIRTPMNGILGFAQLLKEPDLTGDQQDEYIDLIQKGGARMLNIIKDIVDISRIESNLVNLSTSEININKKIEYIYALFKLETQQKQIKLDYMAPLPKDEANVIIDSEKISAILISLIKNAIKFTNKGSVELGYTKKDDYLIFYVKDTGIGIHKDRQEAIFERFIQADIEDKNAYQGAGLGLSISKAYVEMMNGKLCVESEFGKGSTFYFTIPYIVKVNGKQDDNISITYVDDIIKSLKVLIVEDDEVSMDLLKIIMEESHTLYTASNGAEAVSVCKDNSDIDLILMDVKMPIMDGFEATKEIRLFNKDVVIIAQTAYGLAGDRKIATEAGCNNYVSKPIVKNILFSKIRGCFINTEKDKILK